jgi:hypothetical protein
MSRTRYTKQQAERDQSILTGHNIDMTANKNIVVQLCWCIKESEDEIAKLEHFLELERSRSLRSIAWERIKTAWRAESAK